MGKKRNGDAIAARRRATMEWLKAVHPRLIRATRTRGMRVRKHPGRFLIFDADGDVLTLWWNGAATVRWVVPEIMSLAAEIRSILDDHPRK